MRENEQRRHFSSRTHIETRPIPGVETGTALKPLSKTQHIEAPLQAQLERPLCFFSKQIYLEMFCHCLWECVREANVWTDTVETGDV